MARSNEASDDRIPTGADRRGVRHFGDGIAGEIVAARLQGFSSTDVDYRDLAVDSSGNLKLAANVSVDLGTVDQGSAGSAAWKVTDAALADGTQRVGGTVTVDSELPAAALLADGAANPTTPSVGSNGLLWNAANGNWDRAPGNVAGGAFVQGAVASGVADTGNPVKVGGKYNLTQPTFVDGQRGDTQLDSRGNTRSALYFGGVPNVAIANNDVQADARNPANGSMAASGFSYLYSGASNQWDRERANWNGTTGDTGAKATAAFLGATQTNYDSRGAIITCLLGTVTGAVTTWQTGIQWSFDGGTTWLALTPLGANDTAAASGRTYTWIIYPTNTSQAAGGTPANLAPGTITVGGPTQLNVINAALPRTWRFAAQVSVVTSITITSVSVNYIR